MAISIGPPVPPVRAIAIILAYGVLRLHKRQKALDNLTEQSVHHSVLPPIQRRKQHRD